ncbi:TPM domain-containing protein [Myxococcota bacterium]|nr:TPM domain-containing protein [Myxococcota bacterium]
MTDVPEWARRVLRPERIHVVEEAVKAAERETSGEIVPMIVRRSSTIGHIPVIVLSLLITLFMVFDGPSWQTEVFGDHWAWYLVDTLVLLVATAGLSQTETLQRLLTPRDDQSQQVEMRAQVEFYESSIHNTRDATGVLLFVSLMEHRAVVLADEAIDERVPDDTWQEVVNLMVQGIKDGHVGLGLASAIERCGEILAREFPIVEGDVNELHDTLVIKE